MHPWEADLDVERTPWQLQAGPIQGGFVDLIPADACIVDYYSMGTAPVPAQIPGYLGGAWLSLLLVQVYHSCVSSVLIGSSLFTL